MIAVVGGGSGIQREQSPSWTRRSTDIPTGSAVSDCNFQMAVGDKNANDSGLREDSQTDRAREWFALHRIKSVSNFFLSPWESDRGESRSDLIRRHKITPFHRSKWQFLGKIWMKSLAFRSVSFSLPKSLHTSLSSYSIGIGPGWT